MNRTDSIAVLLRAYVQRQANPDRAGCPPVHSLEAFPGDQGAEGSLYDHLCHCRECLLELKMLRLSTISRHT